jgi:hypothetical protein
LLGKTAKDYAHESRNREILKMLARTEFARRNLKENVSMVWKSSPLSVTEQVIDEECEESKFKRKPIKRLDSGPEKRITRNCTPPIGKVCLRHNDKMYLASLAESEYPFPCIVLRPDSNTTYI